MVKEKWLHFHAQANLNYFSSLDSKWDIGSDCVKICRDVQFPWKHWNTDTDVIDTDAQ